MIDDKALSLALLFHETYERLAPNYGYETRIATRQFDPDSPNGRLMIAVCGEIYRERIAALKAERDALRQDATQWKVAYEQNTALLLSANERIAALRSMLQICRSAFEQRGLMTYVWEIDSTTARAALEGK